MYGLGDVDYQSCTPQEAATLERVKRDLEELGYAKAGLTWQQMGYRTADGDVPAWKWRDVLFYRAVLREAQGDRTRG